LDVRKLVLVVFALTGCVERGLQIDPGVIVGSADMTVPPDLLVVDLLPPATISGTFGGTTLEPLTVISDETPTSPGNPSLGVIYLADQPMLCPDLTLNHSQPRDMTYLQIQVAPPQTTGTFVVGGAAGKRAVVKFIHTDGSCDAKTEEDAVGGSVTLSTVTDKAYGGTFDLTMATKGSGHAMDHVTGQFQARYCGALGPLAQGGLSAVCQ
jgi:hypothetical protein